MIDENLTMTQKEQILNYLMKCYRKSCNRVKRYEVLEMVHEHMEIYRHDKTTVMLVDEAMLELSYEEQRIIRNDYMYPKEQKWFTAYYSRSSYYRLKAQAVDKFLRCLHA